jgi:hypothetical protein
VPLLVSVAWTCKETASPTLKTWLPGEVIVIGLLTVQVKLVLAEWPLAVAVTVGWNEPPAVMVPEISPVEVLMDNPEGKPVAE